MRRIWVLLVVVGLVAALGPAAAGSDGRTLTHRWTRQFGTGADDLGRRVAVHPSGVYIVGQTRAALSGQTHQGGWDVLVRKYNHAGQHQWTRQFGTGYDDYGFGVAVDASGVYVVGHTGGALNNITQGGDDAFVRKYDHAGKHQWTRQFGTGANDEGYGVAVHWSGVYVVGSTEGAFPSRHHHGGWDVFVRKYDHAGRHQWTRQFGTRAGEAGYGVAVHGTCVYVVGSTGGRLVGDHQGLTDGFLRGFQTTDGANRWARQFGTSAEDEGWGVAVNDSGVYVVGHTGGALPGAGWNQGESDVFLISYDHRGTHRWTRQFGTSDFDVGDGVAVDADDVYVVGTTWGRMGTHNTQQGQGDVFLRRCTSRGGLGLVRQFGTSAGDFGLGVAADASSAYVVGSTGGKLASTHWGEGDVFLRKYATP